MRPSKALLVLALAWATPGSPGLAEPVDGGRIYHEFCSVCHGDKGDGDSRASKSLNPPPRDFTTPEASARLTREGMIDAVLEGRPGTAMTAWKHQLSHAEAAAVVDHIRERFMLPATEASDNEGRRLYAEYCSVCHGDKGDGVSRANASLSPPPRDFTTDAARRDLNRERMLFSVRHGRPETAMSGWEEQLDEAQIAAVVDYVRRAFMGLDDVSTPMAHGASAEAGGHDRHDGHVHDYGELDMTAPFDGGLVGDPAQGKAFYDDNCATCHGIEGDGRGPRAYFIVPKPRDFGHPAARASLNRPHLFDAIAHGKLGTEMPAWRFVMDPQAMADVAEYVYRAFIVADAGEAASGSHAEAAPHGVPGHAH